MHQKEVTKTFMMILNWKKPFFIQNHSALWGLSGPFFFNKGFYFAISIPGLLFCHTYNTLLTTGTSFLLTILYMSLVCLWRLLHLQQNQVCCHHSSCSLTFNNLKKVVCGDSPLHKLSVPHIRRSNAKNMYIYLVFLHFNYNLVPSFNI